MHCPWPAGDLANGDEETPSLAAAIDRSAHCLPHLHTCEHVGRPAGAGHHDTVRTQMFLCRRIKKMQRQSLAPVPACAERDSIWRAGAPCLRLADLCRSPP